MIQDANWITGTEAYDDICPEFLKLITIIKPIEQATFTLTATGVYEAKLNGTRIGDFILAPGRTVYEKRLQYQTYDITGLLQKENTLSVVVGSGWYRGAMNQNCSRAKTAPAAIIGEIILTYADGTTESIATDLNWTVQKSPFLFADIFDGETYDATKENNTTLDPVTIIDLDKAPLIPQEGEIVREKEHIKPLRLFTTPKGERGIDFGQNLAGYFEFTVTAKAGDPIEFSLAEMLDKDGNFYTDNYRDAKSKIQYICRDGKQTFKPHLTFYGFRYVRLDQFPADVCAEDFTAIAVYSDMKRTGHLRFADPKLNRLYENTVWSQRSNFIDIPTDCPQRDERQGWTGDAQVFAKTASYHYDVRRFFEKWLGDVRAAQKSNGAIPDVVPDDCDYKGENGTAAWGDVITIVPWQMYLTYGDIRFLADNFEAMKGWLSYIAHRSTEPNLWIGAEHYGDWLALDTPPGTYKGLTPVDLIASAFYAHSTQLVIKAGKLLGEDISAYEVLYNRIVKAFKARFHTFTTQTECVLALYMNLTDAREKTAAQLNQLVVQNGNKMVTGFVGTPYLLHVLSDNGYTDTAYSLLLQEEFPSWLYEVNHGATTIWEHWDGINDQGEFWDPYMNSFNHYAYGSVMDWVYEKAAGIRIDETHPGFERVIIAPLPDQRLKQIEATLETQYGQIRSAWYYAENKVRYEISVPTEAEIILDGITHHVPKGDYIF